jgi:hypothetical protein
MATPHLVPALATLRAEFNAIAPRRDKGSDGWIGDAAHTRRISDHNPDPAGRVLAVDIDATGPWTDVTFDALVQSVVDRQRRGLDRRLEYVIWNRRIASRASGWAWQRYTGTSDPHTSHAHFSARHDHTGNASTAPWYLEEAMLTSATIDKIVSTLLARNLGASGPTVGVALQSGYGNSVQALSRITELEGRIADLEAEVAELRGLLGGGTSQ